MLPNWIAGTLELASKVRYGLTSRGVPLFRFIPYDKKLPPMAVGCTARNLMYHVKAIVEPTVSAGMGTSTLLRGNLIQSNLSEQDVLLATYAFDSQKDLRNEYKDFCVTTPWSPSSEKDSSRLNLQDHFTFHIDPITCMDVDDAFTVDVQKDGTAILWIHISDVDAWVTEASPLDGNARRRATSFYTPEGNAIVPMLPRALSEGAASLLVGEVKPAVSLRLVWNGTEITEQSWHLTTIKTKQRYSYDTANEKEKENDKALQTLYAIAKVLGADNDSHSVVEKYMIFYNTQVGRLLKDANLGILRRHPIMKQERLTALQEFLTRFPSLRTCVFEAAEYCLPSDSNTFHAGLQQDAYAYATSPLRRYADLVNQRALKSLLLKTAASPTDTSLIAELNRREKQAKAFQRDWFFSSALIPPQDGTVPFTKGIVLSEPNAKGKVDVYVDAWKRTVKVRQLAPMLSRGDLVTLTWYEDRTQPRWKERIVFSPEKENVSAISACEESSRTDS